MNTHAFDRSRPSATAVPPVDHRTSVLVVEDDPGLRVDLVEYLELQGWSARGAASAADMWSQLQRSKVDLLVLDLGLPDVSGMVELPKLRLAFDKLPILVLSAFSDAATRVHCLEAGADVYLVKDASLELIHASCSAFMRRSAVDRGFTTQASVARAEDARLTWQLQLPGCCLITPNGVPVELSLTELQLLQALMAKPGVPFARDVLLRTLSKVPTLNNLRNLDGAVARLRRKVDQVSADGLPVRSFYGRGYAFMGHARVESVAVAMPLRGV